jgi:hypothetical protein
MAKQVGYYTPETASMVLLVIQELVRQGYVTKGGERGKNSHMPTTITYATATSGIAAGSSASCVMKRRGASGLESVMSNSNTAISITVYNDFSSAVASNALIVAAWSFGKWIVIAEDCG